MTTTFDNKTNADDDHDKPTPPHTAQPQTPTATQPLQQTTTD